MKYLDAVNTDFLIVLALFVLAIIFLFLFRKAIGDLIKNIIEIKITTKKNKLSNSIKINDNERTSFNCHDIKMDNSEISDISGKTIIEKVEMKDSSITNIKG